jgi:hypothetical protein
MRTNGSTTTELVITVLVLALFVAMLVLGGDLLRLLR